MPAWACRSRRCRRCPSCSRTGWTPRMRTAAALPQRADRGHGRRIGGRSSGWARCRCRTSTWPSPSCATHRDARLRGRGDRQQHQRRADRRPSLRPVLRSLRGARRGRVRACAQARRHGPAGRPGAAAAGAGLPERRRAGRCLGASPATCWFAGRGCASPSATAAARWRCCCRACRRLVGLPGAERAGAGLRRAIRRAALLRHAGVRTPTLQHLVATFGASQLMIGTDYPFNFHERRRWRASILRLRCRDVARCPRQRRRFLACGRRTAATP